MKYNLEIIKLRFKLTIIIVLLSALIMPSLSLAALEEFYSATGKIFTSVDGAGSIDVAGHLIDVEKPSDGATVRNAFLLASSNFEPLNDGDVQLNGTRINWDNCVGPVSIDILFSCRADVTALLKPILDVAPAGLQRFDITETNTNNIDGEALVVVFDDSTEPNDRTIILLHGAQSTTGDNFAITFADPIDPSDPVAMVDMGLGIGFGLQGVGQDEAQFSEVNVNGIRLTTSAGGQDDGGEDDGELITVGGLGDSNTNPIDPFQEPNGDPRLDDELYSILPFLISTDTGVDISTLNPSNDDNIFFAYFNLSTVAILGEGIVLSPSTSANPIGTNHTVTAVVVDDNREPVVGREVTFTIISGPNIGTTGMDTSDAQGQAVFNYIDMAGPGTDLIQASFLDSEQTIGQSNTVEKTWEIVLPPVTLPNTCDVNGDLFINRTDIDAIFSARNTPASGSSDPRDADGDLTITVNDVRACVLQCALPACQ